MFKIRTMNRIAKIGIDTFDKNEFICSDSEKNPDALLVRSQKLHDELFGQNLLAIARAGAGVNNIPLERCTEQGIAVFNTPGANANAVKELTVLSLLLASRDISGALSWVQTLEKTEDKSVAKQCEQKKSNFAGPEIKGKTLGVIGLGAIGVKVANAAVMLGMQVLGYDPFVSIDSAWNLARAVKHATSIETLFEQCDYITLHLPATKKTIGMIDAKSLCAMKDGVRIINLARGELVDNRAMLEAIESKKVAFYVCDFCTEELLGQPGVILFPHLGASTPESEENCAVMAAKELMDYLKNGNTKHSVNLPDVSRPRTDGDSRICVIHRNVTNTISRISAAVGDAGLNIDNLVNGSKGDYAYTILDIKGDGSIAQKRIEEIEQVVRVRTLPVYHEM